MSCVVPLPSGQTFLHLFVTFVKRKIMGLILNEIQPRFLYSHRPQTPTSATQTSTQSLKKLFSIVQLLKIKKFDWIIIVALHFQAISMHFRYARNSKFFIGFVDSLLSQPCKYATGYLADKAGPTTTDRGHSILGSCFTGGAIFHWPNAFEFHISEPTSTIKPFSRLGCLLLALKDYNLQVLGESGGVDLEPAGDGDPVLRPSGDLRRRRPRVLHHAQQPLPLRAAQKRCDVNLT